MKGQKNEEFVLYVNAYQSVTSAEKEVYLSG